MSKAHNTTDGCKSKLIRGIPRWMTWKYDKDEKGKSYKRPLAGWGSGHEPLPYDKASAAGACVGFILGEGIGGIDLDACRDRETGVIEPWAQHWIETFATYTEVSPSGTGVKIFAEGAPESLPAHVIDMPGPSIGGKAPQVEAYVTGRWFAYTADRVPETEDTLTPAPKAWAELAAALGAAKSGRGPGYAGRNDALFRRGCALRERGAGDDEVRTELTEANGDVALHENFASEGALGERELEVIIKQVCGYPVGREELAEMNEKHAFIHHWGAAPKIVSWKSVADGRTVAVPQTMADIRGRYDNRRVQVGDKTVGLGTYWLGHPLRKEYDSIGFAPEEDDPKMLNLWRGFGVEAAHGDWSRIQQHIRQHIADGDAERDSYIIRWLAWSVQNPGKPAEVALVMRGGRGTGKGMFARAVMRLFGQHAIHLSNPNQVSGGFNAHHEDCALMFADEAVAPNNKKAREELKRLITEPTLFIERKGIDAYQVKNRLKVIMASNDAWVVPAGPDERRFAVMDVASKPNDAVAYFEALNAEIQGGGPAAMLHELRSMDLEGWHPRQDIPQTKALQEQITQALSPAESGIYELLSDGGISDRGGAHVAGGRLVVPTGVLVEFIRKRTGTTVNGNHLKPLLNDRLRVAKVRERGARCYWFPPLSEVRQKWERLVANGGWASDENWETFSEDPF